MLRDNIVRIYAAFIEVKKDKKKKNIKKIEKEEKKGKKKRRKIRKRKCTRQIQADK